MSGQIKINKQIERNNSPVNINSFTPKIEGLKRQPSNFWS